ncbi:hairy-related 5 [Eucyclogobius newberryi]|uniref:hairy-related 5 n=1 Tax=Eucyclogobius newberryi TaxID=166745 RepID=UPI003B5A34AF
MRAVTSETQAKRTSRRSKVAKPVIEKRRRERINHSLETLRLLLLENMDDERLKNSKVEKAEILESVVVFLQAETQKKKALRFGKKLDFEEEEARQQNYDDGMRTCLRRVSSFIANTAQDSERHSLLEFSPTYASSLDVLGSSPGHVSPSGHVSAPGQFISPGRFGRALMCSPSPGLSPPQLQRHSLVHTQTQHSSFMSQKLNSDTVWRPWPQ